MTLEFATLVEPMRRHAAQRPDETAITLLIDGERQEAAWTYRELDRQVRAIAAVLQEKGAVGERALILHPPGLDFIAALLACFAAGVTAVPTCPPQFNLRSRSAARLARLVQDARPAFALTTAEHVARGWWFSQKEAGLERLRWMSTDDVPAEASDAWRPPVLAPDALAMIQYTSGSTSSPKGVMLTHRNLLSNLAVIHAKFGFTADSRVVSWLPPYHDMGLIGGILHQVVHGRPLVLMAPLHALQKPLRWLQAISRHRATVSGAPNFAYDLCVRGIAPEEREALDLSTWQVAFNGAEPVRAETLGRFARAFAPCGFRASAFYPCYGLAEASLFVTGGEAGRAPRTRSFNRRELARKQAVPLADDLGDEGPGIRLVSCGRPDASHQVAIVDPDSGQPSGDGQIGEIWAAGPSIARGYWKRPDESRVTFDNRLAGGGDEPYLRTGDLGFVIDGELYVAGRLKDLIIVRGRNYYPQDIEESAEASHPALLLNATAAFAVEVEGAEQVVVACEVRREGRREMDTDRVILAVREAVAAALEIRVHGVVLLRPGSLARTTSGKIQRRACRAAFLEKAWVPVAEGFVTAVPEVDPSPDSDVIDEPVESVTLDRAALLAVADDRREPMLRRFLTRRLAGMLKSPEHWLDPDKPLGHLGVDSLVWVELLLQIEAALELSIPPESFAPDLTLAELAGSLVALVADGRQVGAREPSQADRPGAIVDGDPVPLTPTQAEFLRPGVECPEKFSTVLWLRTPAGVHPNALERALTGLGWRHDAFRLRFHRDGDSWRQEYGDPDTSVAFRRLDVCGASTERLRALHQRLNEELPGDFDISRGPLVQAAWLDRGPGQTGLLKLCLHHLVCDGLSVSIVVSGLERAYRACLRAESPERPAGEIAFGEWARELDALAQTESVRRDLPFWQAMGRDLPPNWVDPSAEAGEAKTACDPRLELDATTQRVFLERFPTARAQHEALLAAFAGAWAQLTGDDELFVRLEGHGRQPRSGRAPLTTVGWFVCHYPVRLQLPSRGGDMALLEQVRSTLGAVPHQGSSYGLLTWLCRDAAVRDAMQSLPTARLGLVYYGHLHDVFREEGLFPVLDERPHAMARKRDDRWPDLTLRAGQDRGAIWWHLVRRTDRFGDDTAEALSAGVGQSLRALCS